MSQIDMFQRPPEYVDYDVDETFNKCFVFYYGENANIYDKLPNPDSLFKENKWKVDKFQDLKKILNDTKSKLNDLNLKEWHQHTTYTNIAGDVMRKLKYTIGPEFLTQAWCKMYECLTNFWLVPEELGSVPFNSVHLCEAPGAFITALHHYLQTWYPQIEWNWLATTLSPYYEGNTTSEMIQDDRFILHTLKHWIFGADGTGNLMDKDNLQHLQAQVDSELAGNIMLVTADGSIDCQSNPAEQESLVAPLHYCEAVTALTILQTGGSFVIKMFTLLECESICLVYLLVCSFASVSVFKPVKSKEGNSEVYVVCKGFKGKYALLPWIPTLCQQFGPSINKAMFSEKDIPEDFLRQMYECAKGFTDLQIRVIERNLDLFHNPKPEKQQQSRLVKQQVAERYLQHYQVYPVAKVIVGNDILAETQILNLPQKNEEGSFNDRVGQISPSPSNLLAKARAAMCSLPSQETCWFQFHSFEQPALELTYGRPITTINSSKFCHNQVLVAFNQISSLKLLASRESNVKTSKVLDVGHLPWASLHSQCYNVMVNLLSESLQGLEDSQSLSIRGIPLLSQFTVAVIFLLAHSFFQVGISIDGNVIFCGYQQTLSTNSSTAWLQNVVEHISSLHHTKAVISLLPINILCDKMYCSDNGSSFYFCVNNINNARLLQSMENEVQRIKHTENINHNQ